MKNDLHGKRTLVIIGVVLTLVVPIAAQWKDNMGGNWNNMVSASLGNMINDRLWNRLRAKARARDKASGGSTVSTPTRMQTTVPEPEPPKKSAAQIAAATRFRSTGTQLTTRKSANEFGTTPEEKEHMFQIMGALLTAYETEARRLKRPHDFAFALATALAVNSSIYHGTPEPEDARLLEIGDAIGQLMAESNPFAGIPDRQKQTMYETMIIFTMLAQAGASEAKQTGDAASAEIYRKLAGQTLQAVTGTPPGQINFGADPGPTAAANAEIPPTVSPASTAAMHAAALVREFESNEVRANQAYGGKRVRITGTVNTIEIGHDGRIVLTFKSSISSYGNARCFFAKSQSSRVAALTANEEATVEGTVKGLGGPDGTTAFLLLENCTVP